MQLRPITSSPSASTKAEPSAEKAKNLVIILSAGKATRFFDFGKNYAKSILPYDGKPIIIHNIEKVLAEVPNPEIWITVPDDREISETIENALTLYWGKEFFKENKILFIKQPPRGPGFSIVDAVVENGKRDDLDGVYVILGDILVEDFGAMTEKQITSGREFRFSIQPVNDWSRWCLWNPNTNEFIDKPKDRPKVESLHAMSGIYRFSSFTDLYNSVVFFMDNEDDDKIVEAQILEVISSYTDDEFGNDRATFVPVRSAKIVDFGDVGDWKRNNRVSTSRSFNTISDDDNTVTKSSMDLEKIHSEYVWMKTVGNFPEFSVNVPRVFEFDFTAGHYRMEKVKHPTLRDMFLFLDRSEETWVNVLGKAFDLIGDLEVGSNASSDSFVRDIIFKTEKRIADLPQTMKTDEWVLIADFMGDLKRELASHKFTPAMMHGDMCFSNMFYDGENIRLIDPNGRLYGIAEYDLAKIMHSAVYYYDFVDSNLYLNFGRDYNGVLHYTKKCERIGKIFVDMLEKNGYNLQIVRLLTASLFLSMIPLHSHSEENQRVYFETFKKIYAEWQESRRSSPLTSTTPYARLIAAA